MRTQHQYWVMILVIVIVNKITNLLCFFSLIKAVIRAYCRPVKKIKKIDISFQDQAIIGIHPRLGSKSLILAF